MTEHAPAPAVALLFADTELSAHLREALVALGARIVHEGPATDVRREILADSGAQVVVVNLDAEVEEQLDRLYECLDENTQRVVFNDAQASRGLSGWDQARWARHLAVKLVGGGDVDPPRPVDARVVETGPGAAGTMQARNSMPAPAYAGGEADGTHAAVDTQEPDAGAAADAGQVAHDASAAAALAAELEALLAEGDALLGFADDDTDAAGSMDVAGFDIGDSDSIDQASAIGDPAAADETPADAEYRVPTTPGDAAAAAEPAWALLDDQADPAAAVESVAVEQRQTVPVPQPTADWDLVDFDAAAPASAPRVDAQQFGIEKMDAADYLAPADDGDESPLEPGLTLELVSMEEAVAPSMSDAPVNEMILDDSGGGIRRLVLLGAAAEGAAAVREFLALLPVSLPALLVLVQHQAEMPIDELAGALGAAIPLPVRIAENDVRVRQGEVLLLPAGQQCRLSRDGRVNLQPGTAQAPCDPSIDHCFSAAADAFGSDVVAILFAGEGNDAVAGAQAVRDRGGRVWAQDPSTGSANAMVAVAEAEGLVDFSGTPAALAARLREEYA